MKHIFGRGNSLFSLVIRVFTWSKYSHTGILHEDGMVTEARPFKGVVQTPVDEFKARYKVWEVRESDGDDSEALKHIGKPYDYTAIFGIAMRRNLNVLNAWFCAELNGKCQGIYADDVSSRVTPTVILMTTKPTGEKSHGH